MKLSNALADRQSDAGSGYLGWAVQPLEKAKDLIGIVHVEAAAIVLDRNCPPVAIVFGADIDP
jgi:hypothetical protein